MKRWLLPALTCLILACTPEEVIPPSLRADHEKPEEPAPPSGPTNPTDPAGPSKPKDPLHDKPIPSDFRIPTVHITTEGGKAIDSKQDYVNATFRFEDPSRFYTDEESLELTFTNCSEESPLPKSSMAILKPALLAAFIHSSIFCASFTIADSVISISISL